MLVLLLAIASIASTLPSTLRTLLHDRQTFSRTDAGVRAGFEAAVPFDPEIFTFYRAHLRAGDRFYVLAPSNDASGTRAALALAAGYALLPHVMVARPDQADVVVALRADPRSLALRYVQIVRAAHGVSVARVAR